VTAAGLPDSGRRLDIPRFANTDHFSADPKRIAYVLQRMRIDDKIKPFIAEWKRLFVPDIALNPGILSEVLDISADLRKGIITRERAVIIAASSYGPQSII
jgi:hypothetical protein